MGEVVRLDAREAERGAILRKGGDGIGTRQQGTARALVDRPGAGGGQMHRRIGVGEATQIPPQDVGALGLWQEPHEARVRVGEHGAHAVQEPLYLHPAAQEHAAQHAGRDTLRMGLGVGEGEGGAPRAAEQHPPLDAEVAAQGLDVVHQVVGGVLRQAAQRAGAPRAALVENHHAPEIWIEEAPMHGARARARPAMQEQHGAAARVADLLPIHDVARRKRQIAGLERSDFGEQVAARHGGGSYRRGGRGNRGMRRWSVYAELRPDLRTRH